MQVELVCINYGSFADAIKVTEHCIRNFPRLKKATVLHPDPNFDAHRHSKIDIVPAFSATQHECYVKEMPRWLTCDFAILVQWDGFITHPELWTEEFLDYDYIAPPWPLLNLPNPEWRVGSGGFCMFSRKMALTWAEIGDMSINDDWERGAINRNLYEARGLRYAPLKLAARFGKECDLEDLAIPEDSSFGFHGFQYHPGRKRYRDIIYGSSHENLIARHGEMPPA